MQLWAWAHRRSAYAQLSPLYLLSTLYITHMIKDSRPSTTFLYCMRRKAGRGLGTRLRKIVAHWITVVVAKTLSVVLKLVSWPQCAIWLVCTTFIQCSLSFLVKVSRRYLGAGQLAKGLVWGRDYSLWCHSIHWDILKCYQNKWKLLTHMFHCAIKGSFV